MATLWRHVPKHGRKIAKMFPIKSIDRLTISLVLEGCKKRPFFTIQVKSNLEKCNAPGIEQIGSWDPFPNVNGEQLIGINIERLLYWIGKGAEPNATVLQLMGIGGILPVHHRTILYPMRLLRDQAVKENSDDVSKDSSPVTGRPGRPIGLGFRLKPKISE